MAPCVKVVSAKSVAGVHHGNCGEENGILPRLCKHFSPTTLDAGDLMPSSGLCAYRDTHTDTQSHAL